MNVTQQRMAAIFNEWAKRYAVNPSEFSEIIDENGNVVKDYGESCVIYLAHRMHDKNANWAFGLERYDEIKLEKPNKT